MRKQPYPIKELTGGLDVSKDAIFITDISSPNLNCVRFEAGMVKKDMGFADFSDPASVRPMLMDTYNQLDGSSYFLLLTLTGAWKYNSTNLGFDPIPHSQIFTGDEDDQFQSTVFDDLYIVTNGLDAVYKYNGTTFSLLGGMTSPTVIKAKCVCPFYSHLVLGHTTEDGNICSSRIRWSNTGDPEEWNPLGTNAGWFDLTDTIDEITKLVLMGDRLFVFKERSIWELLYIGGTEIFTARLIIDGIGSYSPHSIICLGEDIIFLGTDNVYLFDGRNLKTIGDQLLPLLYDTATKVVNTSKINRTPGVFIEETGDYALCVPTVDGEPDLLLKWNKRQNNWTKRKLSVTAFGSWSVSTQITWAQLKALGTNWADWERPWKRHDIPSGAPTTIYAFGTPHWKIREDDRITYIPYPPEEFEEFVWSTGWVDLPTELPSEVWPEVEFVWSTGHSHFTFTWGTGWDYTSPIWSGMLRKWWYREDWEKMRWESKDFIFTHAYRLVEVRLNVKGQPFGISYSVDGGLSWSTELEITPSEEDFREISFPLNITTQRLRVRLRSDYGKFEMKWLEPWFIPRKRSKILHY